MKISKEKIENLADQIINEYEIYRQQLLNNISSTVLGYDLPYCSGGVCIEPRNIK